MKIKHILHTLIIFCIVFIFLGCSKAEIEKPKELEEKIGSGKGTFLKTGIANDGNNFYVISQDDFLYLKIIPSRYLVAVNYQHRWKTLGEVDDRYIFQGMIDYFSLDIYSFQSSEKIKTIDINALLEKNYPGYQFFYAYDFLTRPYKGKPCIGVYVEKRPEINGKITTEKLKEALLEIETSCKIAYIDVETEEVYLENYSEEQFYLDADKVTPMIKKIEVLFDYYEKENSDYAGRSFVELNGVAGGVGVLKYFQGTCTVTLPVTSLPERNERLYNMFPELEGQVKEVLEAEGKPENEIPKIRIILTDDPTPEDVMRLILNDDQEITFEGAVLSKQYSIDNEPHEIQSFEDYYQYRKPYESEIDAFEIGPIFPAD